MKKGYPLLVLLIYYLCLGEVCSQNLDSLQFALSRARGKSKVDILNELGALMLPRDGASESREALSLAKEMGYKKGMAAAYNNLGFFSQHQANFKQSTNNFRLAIQNYEALNEISPDFIEALIGISYSELMIGEYEAAFSSAMKSSQLSQEIGDYRYLVSTHLNLSELYAKIQIEGKVYEHLLTAKALLNKTEDDEIAIETYYSLCTHMKVIQNYDSALWYGQEIVKLLNRDVSNTFRTYYARVVRGNMAEIYFHLGNLTEAKALIDQNFQMDRSSEDPFHTAFDYLLMAEIYLKEKNFDQAQMGLDSALHFANMADQLSLFEKIYKAYRALYEYRDFDKYVLYGRLFEKYRDSLTHEQTLEQNAGFKARYDLQKREQDNRSLKEKNQNLELSNQVILLIIFLLGIVLGLLAFFFIKLKRQEIIIRQQYQELSQLNEGKNKLFAIIGHDLRGPLFGLQGLDEQLRYLIESKQSERIDELARNIDRSITYLSETLDNLLNWSLQQMGNYPYEPEEIVVNELLQEVHDLFEANAKAKGIYLLLISSHKLIISADRNALRLILRNILSNAIKFSSKGDTIKLESYQQHEYIHIRISDTGIGMTPAQLDQLEMGLQPDRNRGTAGEKSTGLGLRLCQELLVDHKGEMKIQSKEGKGTEVELIVPIQA